MAADSDRARDMVSPPPALLMDFCSMPVQYECVVGTASMPSDLSSDTPEVGALPQPADSVGEPAQKRSKNASTESCPPAHCVACGKHFRLHVQLRNHMVVHAPLRSAGTAAQAEEKMVPHPPRQVPPPPLASPPGPRRGTSKQGSLQLSPHSCYICSKKFKQVGHLNNHVRLHTGEKPYECQVCSKRFTQSGHLLSHTRMHTNHRPYECKYCNKSFTQSGHLSNHERLHSGERPYQCSVCYKRFTQSGHLSNHMRVHSGERPFECQVCSKSFTQSGHLNNHMRLHTGGKPHLCPMCSKRFAQTGHLNNHIRVHSGERPFGCFLCGKSFVQSGHLTTHFRAHQGLPPGKSGGFSSALLNVMPSQRPAPHIIKLVPAKPTELQGDPSVPAEQTSPDEVHMDAAGKPADVRL